MATAKPKAPRAKRATSPKPQTPCDNHPDREATFHTNGGGAHQWLHLCEQCVPKHWR